ncbi:hypothetical protein GV791_04045 [Nocardia cyriacigeorgica]|uniref:Uncharacterized protein n=1 Tax=Nocardia cyriacigeorgica TaxID=135487 RepID=A0A6P1CJ79_9NOCA|nr:hypothetical protein [Nocardia cyriacigeorgica]MBF6082176.1 hypothetical protein [Nocardia cyriacigeorgica]MBF6285236.1 hypothetical protein [Nocardia cyriacigeorgica]NEW31733.1 hypothetical protein [Nocardia cyriacigeorgica]BDT89407.1 hypothetical protein FMUAM8_51710 [Nocardia cyriacigeorgica]
MDAGDFAGGLVAEGPGESALARLVRVASGLSEEAQRYLVMIADRLRVSEGLPLLDDAGELREDGDGPAPRMDGDGRVDSSREHSRD